MKLHLLGFIAISVLGLGLLSGRTASAQERLDSKASEDIGVQLASSYMEQQKVIRKTAPIHSAVQLATFLARARSTDSPINALSPAAKSRFVNSLRFNENGVTSFYYADIESELSSSQAYDLLSTFGLQSTLAAMPKLRIDNRKDSEIMAAFSSATPFRMMEDHEGYWCSGRATCSRSVGSICMTGC